MTRKDLEMLEIGLLLFKGEQPLEGHCERLLEAVLAVVAHEKRNLPPKPKKAFDPTAFKRPQGMEFAANS